MQNCRFFSSLVVVESLATKFRFSTSNISTGTIKASEACRIVLPYNHGKLPANKTGKLKQGLNYMELLLFKIQKRLKVSLL
jgi:hypothetical protein